MSRLRISTISFLNTVPLMWDFEHGSAGANFDISYTVPSECAAQLLPPSEDVAAAMRQVAAPSGAEVADHAARVLADRLTGHGTDGVGA